jgi:hypothetical protein
MINKATDLAQWERVDLVSEGIGSLTGVDDQKGIQLEVFFHDCEGFGHLGSIGEFELKTETFAIAKGEQIELRTAVDVVEVTLRRFQCPDAFFQCKALPGGSKLGALKQVMHRWNVLEGMKDATVADVDFGGFDEALAHVFVPGLQAGEGIPTGSVYANSQN